jgi:hypothetical protein
MKSLVSGIGVVKPVGNVIKVEYPVNVFELGDEVGIYDQADHLLNVGKVAGLENGVEVEIIA